MNANESIKIEAITETLVNFPEASAEFRAVLEKAIQVKLIYFGFAYGVTPALFVLYQTEEDEYLERIRLTCEDERSSVRKRNSTPRT